MALQDGRHGHPSKLRGEACTFLADYCRGAPHTASSVIQALLQERFELSVSVSQINRIRAALGVSNSSHARQQEKKREYKKFLHLKASGRKVLAASCYSPPPIKLAYLHSWKQPSQRAYSPLIHRCVSPALNLRPCTVKCRPSCFYIVPLFLAHEQLVQCTHRILT